MERQHPLDHRDHLQREHDRLDQEELRRRQFGLRPQMFAEWLFREGWAEDLHGRVPQPSFFCSPTTNPIRLLSSIMRAEASQGGIAALPTTSPHHSRQSSANVINTPGLSRQSHVWGMRFEVL